jgi:hypothetical protein
MHDFTATWHPALHFVGRHHPAAFRQQLLLAPSLRAPLRHGRLSGAAPPDRLAVYTVAVPPRHLVGHLLSWRAELPLPRLPPPDCLAIVGGALSSLFRGAEPDRIPSSCRAAPVPVAGFLLVNLQASSRRPPRVPSPAGRTEPSPPRRFQCQGRTRAAEPGAGVHAAADPSRPSTVVLMSRLRRSCGARASRRRRVLRVAAAAASFAPPWLRLTLGFFRCAGHSQSRAPNIS